jgi:histidinol dehydrogenase
MSPSTNEALLAAASLAGATHFLRVGGAQAIAAAAFGYDGFARCDMVVGPGNAYVAEAKSQLQNRVKIDTVAGPSEVLIVVDDNSYGDWIIEDALAQSEHGDDASAVIVAASQYALNTIQQRLEQIPNGAALLQRGQIQLVLAKNAQDLINFCNRYAPEHLQWCATSIAPQNLSHFGALFVGEQSPVALGDYLSGPNHTLPTMGSARRSAGLSVADFVRLQTRQTVHNATELYHHAAILAQAEGLLHHRDSLLKRKK